MSDYRDPELEHMLGRMSGAYPDANSAYVAVTGRVRQVKRRRAFVASTAACVVLLGVGALAVRGGSSQGVQVASESSAESSEATASSVSTSVEDDSTSSTEATESSAAESSSSVEPVTVASLPGTSAGSSSPNKGSSTSSANTTGSSNSGSGKPTVTAPNGTTTYPSEGGSIDVAVTSGALSLVSDTPAAGFTSTIKHNRWDRVEVEFSDGNTTWRIRVDLVDGAAVVQTTQHGN